MFVLDRVRYILSKANKCLHLFNRKQNPFSVKLIIKHVEMMMCVCTCVLRKCARVSTISSESSSSEIDDSAR